MWQASPSYLEPGGVNGSLTDVGVHQLRQGLHRDAPFGSSAWIIVTAALLGLEVKDPTDEIIAEFAGNLEYPRHAVHRHRRILPVARCSLRTYVRLRERCIGHAFISQIGLVGAEHRKLNLFIRERFIAGSQDTLPVQNLHGVDASYFERKGPELVCRQKWHLNRHPAMVRINKLTQCVIDWSLHTDDR